MIGLLSKGCVSLSCTLPPAYIALLGLHFTWFIGTLISFPKFLLLLCIISTSIIVPDLQAPIDLADAMYDDDDVVMMDDPSPPPTERNLSVSGSDM